ncbi:formate hydrogenlyase regulator HycA [Pantoea sp. C2G6]|uniref:formate hydrogenlyase regulator HycA n=1 Tax=Pantoea sp. C2G6 TaxID=3243084 RepID=UPI003EDAA186
MSILSELTSQANYIASRNNCLKSQWHTYRTSLVQAVMQENKQINHEFSGSEGRGVHFRLFSHFLLSVQPGEAFHSQEIVYSLNMAKGEATPCFLPFACARLSDDGWVDGMVDIQDKPAVLEHYLNKIAAIYQTLFDALKNNQPVQPQLEKLLASKRVRAEKKA